ncbi:cleavage and polyadenylation specificity factor subunit 1 [Strigomonas culicis]|uniref:Cleavage and polyadenylation specificity factor subunit 1 n=1 Tax=Strigomonas culicis TaxID=28005 RepID=S9VJD6_9TRYP|nr:cleavage and polyadenylation specificity factor subunit 1 [Strigomonas culicis]|eukprot:EPY23335.1 cleavage and polyadenylation specificity factor subunit 1 [Strigomonas culicis]
MLKAAVSPSLPASAVTHTLSGRFSNDPSITTNEVVVISQNVLTLYREEEAQPSPSATAADANVLVHTAEVTLYAPPLHAVMCRPADAPVDILTLLFDDFHISFLQFNPISLQFDTVGLVQLDDRPCALEKCPLNPIMRVDPSGVFIAVLAKRTELFFFPVLRYLSREACASAKEKAEAQGASEKTVAAVGSSRGHRAAPAAASAPKAKVNLDAWGDEDDDDEEGDEEGNAEADELAASEKSGAEEEAHAAPAPTLTEQQDPSGVWPYVIKTGTITHVRLTDVKETLRNVRDFQFVESTSEPLIAFLYERYPTWAGRVKIVDWRTKTVESNMLTCSVLWTKVTLPKTVESKLLVIGDVEHLSYAMTHMVAVPAIQEVPSAVLCFSMNTVVHVCTKNSYGAYVNLNGKEEVDNIRSTSILYQPVTWTDHAQERSLDVVRTNLNLANCLALPFAGTGGKPAGSLNYLLFTEEEGTVVHLKVQTKGYSVVGLDLRIVMTGCFSNSFAALRKNHFFLGSDKGDSRVVALQLTATPPLKEVQTILGLGTIRDVELVSCGAGQPSAASEVDPNVENSPFADLFHNVSIDPLPQLRGAELQEQQASLHVAVCTGKHSSGALCVLRRSVRESVIIRKDVNATSSFFLDRAPSKRSRDDDRSSQSVHLLLTGMDFTLLFTVRSDAVQQVRGVALHSSARTVYAAQLRASSSIVQVTEQEVHVVSADGKRLLQHITFGIEKQIKTALLLPNDRLFVLFEDGTLTYLDRLEDKSDAEFVFMRDVRALAHWAARDLLVVLRGMDLVFLKADLCADGAPFYNFAVAPTVAVEGAVTPLAKLPDRIAEEPLPTVSSLHVYEQHAKDVNGIECTLVLLTSCGELLTYRLFRARANGPRRLVKDVYYMVDVQPEQDVVETIEAKKLRQESEQLLLKDDTQRVRNSSVRLVAFEDRAWQQRGVYVCGERPVFLVFHPRQNRLVPSPHQVAGPVRGFSPFHSRHVVNGYVCCCEGFVNIATCLPFGEPLSNGWWVKRVFIGATPHKAVYTPSAQSLYVVTSTPQPYAPKRASFDIQYTVQHGEDGTRSFVREEPLAPPVIAANSGYRVPTNERFALQLMSCKTWRCMDRMELEENEHVMGIHCASLPRDTSTDVVALSPFAPICVLATAFPLGEDVTTRGRVLLCATKRAAGEHQLRVLHTEPMKGPVTAVASINHHIAVAVGGTVRVFKYDSVTSKMEMTALLYAGAYVTHLTAFKDYLIVGDLYKSSMLCRFSAQNHTLLPLGRDINHISVVHNEALYKGDTFGILSTDDNRNVAIFGYEPRVQPGNKEGGKSAPSVLESLLTVDGEYRMPSGSIVKTLRLRASNTNACVALYVTNYGEIGYLICIGDQLNQRAQWVSRRLQTEIAHPAGLPPRMFLSFNQEDPKHALRAKEPLVHAPLIESLCRLDMRTRKSIVCALTQIEKVMSVGATIASQTSYF